MEDLCPVCSSATLCEPDCPGYSVTLYDQEFSFSCIPPCGNALKFTCTQCSWWYRTDNQRKEPTMGVAPHWAGKYFWEEEAFA